MDESTASAPLSGKRLRFSLLQLVAMTTAVGASFAVCFALFSPPLGSSGLSEAILPAIMLAAALWFCRSGTATRLGTYAVIASLLAILFFANYMSQTDWLFGHTHGPPQLLIASCISSIIGTATGIGWLVMKFASRRASSTTAQAAQDQGLLAPSWLGNSAVVVLTLLSGLLALLTTPDLPRAQKQLDQDVEQRWRTGRYSMRTRAESVVRGSSSKRAEMAKKMAQQYSQPGDEAAIPALLKLVRDNDPLVRRAASTTLRNVINQAANMGKPATANPEVRSALAAGVNDEDDGVRRQVALAVLDQNLINFDDRPTRLAAIAALGSAQDRDAVDEAVPMLLRVIEGPPDEAYRIEAIRSLSKIGPNVRLGLSGTGRQAVYRLSILVESRFDSPAIRSEAAKALAAMGPVAKEALPSIGRGWQQQLLTVDDAQAMYQISSEAAERWKIPNVQSIKPEQKKLLRDEYLRASRPSIAPVREGNPNDPEYLVSLVHTLNDDDSAVRFNAASALYATFRFPMRFRALPPSVVDDLIAATKRPEPKVCGAALAVLRYMGPAAEEAVPALLEITKNPSSSPDRLQAIYALGEIGPVAAEAVPRLSEILTADTKPHERSAAAKALGFIGKAAKPAVPAFREAWKKHLLTTEDAQALYRIDQAAAEELMIPRRQPGP